jgi:predicted dehydrogenase
MKYSRREFIKGVGAGSALLALPSVSTISRLFPRRDEKKLRVALVGLGNYATHQLAPALQQTKYCTLGGIVTGTPEKASQWKKEYGLDDKNIYNYQNFDSIAKNDAIDVVYVVLPNSMHREFVLRAAVAGKHVFCEKPMAVSVKEGQEMIDACSKAGVRLFIGYRLHSEPYNQYAMKFRTNDVGKLKTIESEFAFKIGDPTQWRLRKALAGGGALMDLGIYAIQAARYSTGEEPLTVTATEEKTDPVKFKEVDETIRWEMQFPGGAKSKSYTSYNGFGNRLRIEAEKGWLELDPAFTYGPIKGKTNQGELNFPLVNQQAAQMDDFAQCIAQNCKSNAGGEEGLRDMKVIEAIYRSIASGAPANVG